MSPADGIPAGRKIPLVVTLDEIARPPEPRVTYRRRTLKLDGGTICLENGDQVQIASGSITVCLT